MITYNFNAAWDEHDILKYFLAEYYFESLITNLNELNAHFDSLNPIPNKTL